METPDLIKDILPLKDKLYRLALRITLSRPEAEDIVQETIVRMWDDRKKLQKVTNIEAYAYRMARNMAIDHTRRKAQQNKQLGAELENKQDHSPDPLQQTTGNDHMRIIKDIMNQLPESQKTVILLRDFEGKSYKEIAEIMEINEQQVKTNIFRARQAIKTTFDKAQKYGL